MLHWLRSFARPPVPAGPPEAIKRFTTDDGTISQDPLNIDDAGWSASLSQAQTVPLFELVPPHLEHCVITWRAQMRTEKLTDRVYLEMLCRFPGRGEFFSKGFDHAVTGTNDWASYEVSFYLKKGESPDLLKLNLVAEGAGGIWIKDVELSRTPLT